jgi:uncharacterized protein (DUF1778 family)
MRIVGRMTPRTGRPPSDNPRSVVLSVRVTADEAARLSKAADAAGVPVTAWIRDRALAAARRTR